VTERKAWSYVAGKGEHRVRVFELVERDGVLYLRWNEKTQAGAKRRHESLGKALRTTDGKIIREVERWAKAQADAKHLALVRGEGSTSEEKAPVTIGEAKGLVTDPKTGKYPHASQHRKETERALDFAAEVWGLGRAWNTIRRADLRQLGRARIDDLLGRGKRGLRGAELTVQRVLTVAQWLRDEELIDEGAAVAKAHWKDELRSYWLEAAKKPELPTPHRPRHTIEEFRAILRASWKADRRLGLLLEIGAEQRLGQVTRVHRSMVSDDFTRIRIPSRGQKRGAMLHLTPAQTAAVRFEVTTGYLSDLEAARSSRAIADYPLFPAGQMPGGRSGAPKATVERHAAAKPMDRRTIVSLFAEAERAAGVAHVKGRGAYGLRRVAVDEAKLRKISRDAMREHGGWSDNQMPDTVYADQESERFRDEARDVRADIRGESSGEKDENGQQTTNTASEAESGV
jgi:hypothetical protein